MRGNSSTDDLDRQGGHVRVQVGQRGDALVVRCYRERLLECRIDKHLPRSAAVFAPKRMRHEAKSPDGAIDRAEDGDRPFRRLIQGHLDRGRRCFSREQDVGGRKGTARLVRPDACRPKNRTRAFASDRELHVAGTISFSISRSPARRCRDRAVKEPHDDIRPGQTMPLRINDIDLDHDGTLIRGRFRDFGTRRGLRDLEVPEWDGWPLRESRPGLPDTRSRPRLAGSHQHRN